MVNTDSKRVTQKSDDNTGIVPLALGVICTLFAVPWLVAYGGIGGLLLDMIGMSILGVFFAGLGLFVLGLIMMFKHKYGGFPR
jgi:hypothetical protein